MIWLGLDPDTHNCPLAMLSEERPSMGADWSKEPIETVRGWLTVRVYRVLAKLTAERAGLAMIEQIRAFNWGVGIFEKATLAVEMQHFAPGQKARPQDIARLTLISGAALGAILADRYLAPLPVQWKGSVPKKIHHARIARHLGWELRDGVPADPAVRALCERETDWKHALDAIGLALWAQGQTR